MEAKVALIEKRSSVSMNIKERFCEGKYDKQCTNISSYTILAIHLRCSSCFFTNHSTSPS